MPELSPSSSALRQPQRTHRRAVLLGEGSCFFLFCVVFFWGGVCFSMFFSRVCCFLIFFLVFLVGAGVCDFFGAYAVSMICFVSCWCSLELALALRISRPVGGSV